MSATDAVKPYSERQLVFISMNKILINVQRFYLPSCSVCSDIDYQFLNK